MGQWRQSIWKDPAEQVLETHHLTGQTKPYYEMSLGQLLINSKYINRYRLYSTQRFHVRMKEKHLWGPKTTALSKLECFHLEKAHPSLPRCPDLISAQITNSAHAAPVLCIAFVSAKESLLCLHTVTQGGPHSARENACQPSQEPDPGFSLGPEAGGVGKDL